MSVMVSKRPSELEPSPWYRGANIPMRVIRDFARRVAERFQPDKIILFGSYAYGQPHVDSDVDILVVMDARNQLDQAVRINLACDANFPLDLIVRTPKNMKWRLEEGDSFLREIVSRGKVLYSARRTRGQELSWLPEGWSVFALRGGEKAGTPFSFSAGMRRLTKEWVRKAERDYRAAEKLGRGIDPLYEQVCFHRQQCAEKYLKALLEELGVGVPRTHDLQHLLGLLLPHHGSLTSLERGLKFLTRFAVGTRYPGEDASKRQALAAFRWAGKARAAVRPLLGLRPPRKRGKKSP
jgi:HEPN domain-containing protein/predicted nucleotidyltransferase